MRHDGGYPPDWLLILLLAVGVYLWQRTVFPLWMVDILPLQVASYQWLTGAHDWIYRSAANYAEWEQQAQTIAETVGGLYTDNTYYYAPFMAAGLSPFAKLPAELWRNVLFVINTLLIFVNSWFVLKLCNVPVTLRSFAWAAVIPLLAYPLSRATMLGQIVPLLAVLFWFGLLMIRNHRTLFSGFLLGLSGAVKLFPLCILAVLLFARKWRLLASVSTVVIVLYAGSLLLLGWNIHAKWWESVTGFGSLVVGFWGNQSVAGWFGRLFLDSDVMSMSMQVNPVTEFVRITAAIIFTGGTLVWMYRKRTKINDQNLPFFVSVLFAAVLLSIANSWEHYWLFCLPVLGWAIHDVWKEGRLGWSQLWIAATAFFYLMKLTRFYTDTLFGRLASGSQTVGMLMLWGWLIWRLSRTENTARAIDAHV